MIKILFLVQKDQRIILDRFYDAIGENCDMDIRWLDDNQQANLRKYFNKHVDRSSYDRIVLFLRFKKEIRQVSFLRTIPNLVFLEHDAYQNYIDCKYRGKFSAHYRQIPWVRILSSGVSVARRLQEEGFDAVFVAKGYDDGMLKNNGLERDIELGFVGSTKSATYSNRKAFLGELAAEENLLVTRTRSGEEYLQTLNRIRFFVSADLGMQEYMIKNFEAMACGCLLFAYDQGEEENQALGLIDMENIVLYRDLTDFKKRLHQLRSDNELAAKIATAGQTLVEKHFTFSRIGADVVRALEKPLRPMPEPSRWQKIRNKLGF